MGGVLFALIVAIHHWWPKMTGKMFSEKMGKFVFWLAFIGYNGTFIPQFVMGSQGMPRRYHEYLPKYEVWHQMSSYSSFLFGLSLFGILFYLLHSLKSGKTAPHNPWDAVSMEWECATPPIEHNFIGQPICKHGPYDFQINQTEKAAS